MSEQKIKKVLWDMVLVLEDKTNSETKTPGGIIMTSVSSENLKGIVKVLGDGRIGPDGTLIKIPLELNDTVTYAKKAGTELTHNNEKYRLLTSSEIRLVLEPEKDVKDE